MISLRNALQIITNVILVSEDDNVRLSFQDLTLKEPFQHSQISRELGSVISVPITYVGIDIYTRRHLGYGSSLERMRQ